jgi:energy-coupling factor transporter ATP-binding protein EcfA2
MQVTFGVNHRAYVAGDIQPVLWDPTALINGHIVILGDTGSGKTHLVRQIISGIQQTAKRPPRIVMFDAHGDMGVSGESCVQFSEASGYGLNPFEIDPDPHFGGVRRCIQTFINNLNRTTHRLGVKQESVLRTLLLDLFLSFGFDADDPSTWHGKPRHAPAIDAEQPGKVYLHVPASEVAEARYAGVQFDEQLRLWYVERYAGSVTRWPEMSFDSAYPTMMDLLRFSAAKMRGALMGANTETMRQVRAVNREVQKLSKASGNQRAEHLEQLEALQEKALAAFSAYLQNISSGTELDNILKYKGYDILAGVVDRIRNLNATGVFRNMEPPFDPMAPIWRADIRAYNESEKKLFVDTWLGRLYTHSVKRGLSKEIRDVIVIDEAHIYTDQNPDHILNRVIRESRKFGVALLMASQNPAHFPDDLISGCATKLLLTMDASHYGAASKKFGAEPDLLRSISPLRSGLVSMKRKGAPPSGYQLVEFPR